jgi:hypothetical protein
MIENARAFFSSMPMKLKIVSSEYTMPSAD